MISGCSPPGRVAQQAGQARGWFRERVPQPGGYYDVLVKVESEYLDATESSYAPAGTLAVGTSISAARFTLGPGQGNSWSWRDKQTGKTYLVAAGAVEVVRFVPRSDYVRAIREQQMKPENP